MDVAREVVHPGWDVLKWMVSKQKFFYAQGIMNNNPLALILVSAHNVVIAHHQVKPDRGKMLYHLAENFPFGVVMAVEQISQAYDPPRLTLINQVDELLEVMVVCLRRYRYPGASEMVDLPQMEV